MLVPTLIMAGLAMVLLGICLVRGQQEEVAGLQMAWKMIYTTLPLLIFAFTVAGFLQVLLPRDLLAKWVGTSSGWRGLLIGTLAGALTPGGPYVSLPMVAILMKSGASAGTLVAFLTAWSLWAIARLPLDIGIVGWQFTLLRFSSVFFFPPLAGLIANNLARFYRWG
jgi:uncharacterized membrane protein YraQ (UPF0718 family)